MLAFIEFCKILFEISEYCCKISELFSDKVGDIIKRMFKELGEKQFKAAVESLDLTKISDSPQREIESAITNLRSAYEITPLKISKCETSLLIAVCYKSLDEYRLKEHYKTISLNNFQLYKNDEINKAKESDYFVKCADIGMFFHPFSSAVSARKMVTRYFFKRGKYQEILQNEYKCRYYGLLEQYINNRIINEEKYFTKLINSI